MITIDQLLESIDLDFEPRWIAKDKGGLICVYTEKPECGICSWFDGGDYMHIGYLKLSEFADKDWQECIYEIKKKEKPVAKIERLNLLHDSSLSWGKKINELVDMVNNIISVQEKMIDSRFVVDAVNELKAKFTLPTLNPDLTDEDLRKIMRDPKYWRDKDSAIIKKVQDGFNKLYGDKN